MSILYIFLSTVFYIACNCAYADVCLVRTNSFNYMSAFYFLAEVGGSWIGSLLLSQHIYLLNGLSIACFALTTYVSGAIPSHCGYEEQHEYPEPIISNLEDEYHDTRQPLLAESIILSHEFNPKVKVS